MPNKVVIRGAQMDVDHIWPRSRGGASTLKNICQVCAWCDSRKGTQTNGLDPDTYKEIRLFHLREAVSSKHFAWDEVGLHFLGTAPLEMRRRGTSNEQRVCSSRQKALDTGRMASTSVGLIAYRGVSRCLDRFRTPYSVLQAIFTSPAHRLTDAKL